MDNPWVNPEPIPAHALANPALDPVTQRARGWSLGLAQPNYLTPDGSNPWVRVNPWVTALPCIHRSIMHACTYTYIRTYTYMYTYNPYKQLAVGSLLRKIVWHFLYGRATEAGGPADSHMIVREPASVAIWHRGIFRGLFAHID
jgi:hypothetical protein